LKRALGRNPKIIGVIPARYASTRLPGKPLVDLCGKPMIQRVYERVLRAELPSDVLVATDDDRIFNAVSSFGGKAVMTPPDLASGTDRLAFVAGNLEADVFINIQGDEPLIDPSDVDRVAGILLDDSRAAMGTLIRKISSLEELESPNTAKVVLDQDGYAVYFSRSAVPHVRDEADRAQWFKRHILYKHVGLYSYRKDFLLQFAGWPPSELEKMEKLEQLRAIEHGFRIKTAEAEFEPVCVDTAEDAERVRRILEESGESSGR
jgi:3-deoxy-manno-octulosonate cytidylyltransferase (CMP-KDO synthetase)